MIELTSASREAECGCGGMADAQDSKSCGGDLVRVQVPPSAVYRVSGAFMEDTRYFFDYSGVILNYTAENDIVALCEFLYK